MIMKSFPVFVFLVLASSFFVLGCGADHPFTRGEILDSDGNLVDPTKKELTVSRSVFENQILPKLKSDCSGCHANKAPTYELALEIIVIGKPDESKLYQKASGQGHPKKWPIGSVEAEMLATWILGE